MIRLKLSAIVFVSALLPAVGGAQNTNPNQRLTPSEIDSISPTGPGQELQEWAES